MPDGDSHRLTPEQEAEYAKAKVTEADEAEFRKFLKSEPLGVQVDLVYVLDGQERTAKAALDRAPLAGQEVVLNDGERRLAFLVTSVQGGDPVVARVDFIGAFDPDEEEE